MDGQLSDFSLFYWSLFDFSRKMSSRYSFKLSPLGRAENIIIGRKLSQIHISLWQSFLG